VPPPKPISVQQSLNEAQGWSNSNVVSNKFAAGTLSTAKYHEKTAYFTKMNELAAEKSSLFP